MKALLDSHALLWFLMDDEKLSETASDFMCSLDNVLFVSPATLWELAIKISLGKLALPCPFDQFFQQGLEKNQIEILPVSLQHLSLVAKLPYHHRYPFDRLLIAQAVTEEVPLVSADKEFRKYDLTCIW